MARAGPCAFLLHHKPLPARLSLPVRPQLLIYYMRLAGPEGILLQRCGSAGAALCKEAISSQMYMLELKRVIRSG